jgi:cytochrome c oxidase subunit 1
VSKESKLVFWHLVVAVCAFGIAAFMAVMQAMSRANMPLPGRSESIYYLSVTTHGVLMAYVFTTFFIMAIGYFLVQTALQPVKINLSFAWICFWVALLGVILTTITILAGQASVLYTFYPPMKAFPTFYIGIVMLVLGSWGWSYLMLKAVHEFKKLSPNKPVPLAVHGMTATVLIWLLSSPAAAVEILVFILPWSLGWTKTINPLLSRTLFWFLGHPIVYFWLLPAYLIWYAILPAHLDGKLFSDKLGRITFVIFILFSTPVGLHHQLMDPGISAKWKLLQVLNTYAILLPSFITAFTILATFEWAGRKKGGKGLFGWIFKLPWSDPFFSSVALSMLLFTIGGFGGAVNAALGMNAMVHNTAWITGHFHITLATTVALTLMGFTYWLLPRITNRDLALKSWAEVQPYLWFLGMFFFAIPNHILGLMGMPRRIYATEFYPMQGITSAWGPWDSMTAAGGVILFVSALFYLVVVFGTIFWGKEIAPLPVRYAEPLEGEANVKPSFLENYSLWTIIAVVMILIAYGVPLFELLKMPYYGSPPYKPY